MGAISRALFTASLLHLLLAAERFHRVPQGVPAILSGLVITALGFAGVKFAQV